MDRLAKLRQRSSANGPLNQSSASFGTTAGYETANDESVTSGCSLYFSMNETDENTAGSNDTEPQQVPEKQEEDHEKTLPAKFGDTTVDQTLENDFSVEEVSTIRKAIIMQASPATVKVANKMSVKYLGTSSTPARTAKGSNLSGLSQLDDTEESKQNDGSMLLLENIHPPELVESFHLEEKNEGNVIIDKSNDHSQDTPVKTKEKAEKSFGTNVLAGFFATMDVNQTSNSPPTLLVTEPPSNLNKTPDTQGRDSNPLQALFESINKSAKKPQAANKENVPRSAEHRRTTRKSLLQPTAGAGRGKPRTPLLKTVNRVASPITKPVPITRKSSLIKLIPDRLREMRKSNQSDQLVKEVKRRSGIPPPRAASASLALPNKTNGTTAAPVPRAVATALKRNSVLPSAIVSRRSVLPPKTTRRTMIAAPPTATTLTKTGSKAPIIDGEDGTDAANGSIPHGKRPPPTEAGGNATEKAPAVKKMHNEVINVETNAKLRKSVLSSSSLPSRIRPPTNLPIQTSGALSTTTGFKKPETFTCTTCQRNFRLRSTLEVHKRVAHQGAQAPSDNSAVPITNTPSNEDSPTESESRCRYCDKHFANSKFLANHILVNCQKVPLLEKRKLLAESEQQRATGATRASRRSVYGRPASSSTVHAETRMRGPKLASGGDGSVSTDDGGEGSTKPGSLDGTSAKAVQDDSNSSSASSNASSVAIGRGVKLRGKNTAVTTIGHTGITRTPQKELVCQHCTRRFLNAVEFALHVEAHAKNSADGSNRKQRADDDGGSHSTTTGSEVAVGDSQRIEVSKIGQKLTKLHKQQLQKRQRLV